MQLTFIETSIFSRDRSKYFDDDEFRRFENCLLENPETGDVITGTGGCRKVRWNTCNLLPHKHESSFVFVVSLCEKSAR